MTTAAPARVIQPISMADSVMGGRLVVHLEPDGRPDQAVSDARRVISRIDRWAARLSRHSATSDLSALNADTRSSVPVRPTLASALVAGLVAADASEGFTDITLLDARLTAEGLGEDGWAGASRLSDWQIKTGRRGSASVSRPPGLRFDLGGVGKGWIADRALHLMASWPNVLIDADGDLAIRCAPGDCWEIGIDDPRRSSSQLALLRLQVPSRGVPSRWGVATSGTSIHQWTVAGTKTHHLIDPRTGRPAVTDIVQATVIAGSTLRAEALAKAAVIAGRDAGFALLQRSHAQGAVLLTATGEVLALPSTLELLAA
ncbi:MAG TPA: FAD:protein FMN transferase [Candidatus Limnocylindrales bacterium]